MTVTELKTAMRRLGYDPGRYAEVIRFAETIGVTHRAVYFWLSPDCPCNIAKPTQNLIRKMVGA